MRRSKNQVEKAIARTMDYKRAFSSEQGKRVLYDLIASHHVMRSTFVPNDAIQTAFNEGARNVILRILTIMETTPEQMENLLRSSNNDVLT